MTRPKVSPEKRQRTAQACDSCKRRKQKCNGFQPCNTCTKRNLSCTYATGPAENDSTAASSDHTSSEHIAKRRNTGDLPPAISVLSHLQGTTSLKAQHAGPSPVNVGSSTSGPVPVPGGPGPTMGHMNGNHLAVGNSSGAGQASQPLSRAGSGTGEGDEEAVVYTSARMLQDPTGRLLYIGDSATLSYLQLIRMIVESSTGPSPFTMDPQRHRIIESIGTVAPTVRNTHLLPDRITAMSLIESFFINTNGFIEVFSRKSFLGTFDACYADPLNVDPSWLCLLHLVFAIGLVLANPSPGSQDDIIVQKLRTDSMDRAEMFYRNAKSLSDPVAGFEDADFWSVQALVLMTVYSLTVSKRNAAYAFHGMAVRSAFALGLHREETMVIFSDEERGTRRNLWRSLFILDRFLAASLGRPTAISEDDCSGDVLGSGDENLRSVPSYTSSSLNNSSSLGLEASVRSCRLIGIILKKVYSKRKISTKLAQQIADDCKGWSKSLDPSLNWRQVSPTAFLNPAQGVTILHVNLLYCHTIVLLTRPFFLHLLHKVQQDKIINGQRSQRFGARMEKFSEACVIASCHSIVLVQNAWSGGYLSRRNPFVSYFLFASTLIVLSNEYSKLYDTPAAQSCISSAIEITAYCGETDPLARRLLFILTSFRDVVNRQKESSRIRTIPYNNEDPISALFTNNNSMISPTIFSGVRAGSGSGVAAPSSGPSITTSRFPDNDLDPSMRLQTQSPLHLNLPTMTNSPEQDRSGGINSNNNNGAPSVDGSDSLGGDAEIDFDAFWNLSSGLTPGIGGTPLPTPGGVGFDPNNIQNISDSMVPLYGTAGFGGP